MKENKFYKIAFVLMLLLNIVVLGYLFLSKPKRPSFEDGRPNRPANPIAIGFEHASKTMNLDDSQLENFRKLVTKHKGEMKDINERQRDILKPLFKDSNNTDSFSLEKLGNLEQEKVQLTLDHFKDIKKILREEQYEGFDSFKNTVSIRLLSDGKKPPPRRRKH